ncbi:MAG: hypothetical protein GAK30_01361 [Paracidovorax wautersii]|uniref:Toxin VasX N-terminal region domain-containing protein n=1 Tax=Paracidovorax wautersii TaxID=1177982 RepID=A0A7V8FPX1_9BURK|nr:MAG: hypothetical protein GAK30_01361 [Paracidovorax wautersii]
MATTTNDGSAPCENCTRTGFPILFTRYAIAYSATNTGRETLAKFIPKAPMQAPEGIRVASSNVRMLRAGYLYLYLETNGGNEWKSYAVHPNGYVSEFAVESPAGAKGQRACQRSTHPANASLIWIEDAKHVSQVWYLFNPDPLDFQHLKQVIEPQRAQFMQSFSPSKWLNGERTQAHTTTPSMLGLNVLEYAALADDKLPRYTEQLLFGLMGGNAQERGWGDYEEVLTWDEPVRDNLGLPTGFTEPASRVRVKKQPGYAAVHGERLRGMERFLGDNSGAIVACTDAIGIAQELGHMQTEAQTLYTAWQVGQASDQAQGVTNEWVFQSAVGARGMQELIKKNAIRKAEDRLRPIEEAHTRYPRPMIYATPELREEAAARRQAGFEAMQREVLGEAASAGDRQFNELFDQPAADAIIAAQRTTQGNVKKVLDAIGQDQSTWIKGAGLRQAMARYSARDDRIDKPGGGAALSLQLAQCLAGTETNASGQKLLAELDLWGDNVLSKLACFNNESIKSTLKKIDEAGRPATLPAPNPPDLAQAIADRLKPIASEMNLGDKALGFIDAAKEAGWNVNAALRQSAWPLLPR